MDQAVCRIHNILCRTVIPFQFENTATRILVLELQDIIDIGSSERINTLRIIPNHTDTPMHFAQTLHDQMLCKVRILILVHQHKLEKAPVFLQYVRMIAEEDVRLQQQIVEIHRPRLLATVLIPLIYLTQQRDFRIYIMLHQLLVLLIRLIGNKRVFRIRDTTLYHSRPIHFVVELHLLQNGTEQAFGICRIVNGKIGRIADTLRLGTENTGKDGMERSHP